MSQVSIAAGLELNQSDKFSLNLGQLGKLPFLGPRQSSFTGSNMSVSNILTVALNKARSYKSPGDMVQRLHHYVSEYERAETEDDKNKFLGDIFRYLTYFKCTLLGGDGEKQIAREDAFNLAQRSATTNLLYLLVDHLPDFDFEGKKLVAVVFNEILKQKDSTGFSPGAQYVSLKPEILSRLARGYEDPSVALVCGSMLRDCIQIEKLTKVILEGPVIRKIFNKVHAKNFEIASDAFFTLRVLLTTHKNSVAEYLLDESDEFQELFSKLLGSENFVTRIQSLKLLGELMMAKENVHSTVQFVSDVKNLVLIMNLLKDEGKSIQYEAFHIFKVFVANPNKSIPVKQILIHNREKLVKFMEEFFNDRVYDEQFISEKAFIIQEISNLQISSVAL